METVDPLVDDSFWDDATPLVMSGDKRLARWAWTQPCLSGHVLFQTSGSTGTSKHVCLSRAALRASARMVNTHLHASPEDRWLGALPRHHVGGFGILARAALEGIPAPFLEGKWNPHRFHHVLQDHGTTLTSLVPTQVFDLIAAALPAPPALRAALVGGGALSPELEDRARALSWPLLKTYGMTETASQIATQALGAHSDSPLEVLSGWETSAAPDGRLRLRGEALFTGYVVEVNSAYQVRESLSPGECWFTTEDRVALSRTEAGVPTLRFLQRTALHLKIKGERVDLEALRLQLAEAAIARGIAPETVTLAATAHLRDEQALVLVVAPTLPREAREGLRIDFEAGLPRFLNVPALVEMPIIPRTRLGKVIEPRLQREVDALTGRQSLP